MTHLSVPVDCLANLVTMQLPNNNKAQPFYFDRSPTLPFVVPPAYSFVITDIFVEAETTSYSTAQFLLVVVTIDGGRSIEVRCGGYGAHVALSGGLVVPAQGIPGADRLNARNTTFSNGPAQVQVLGYYVKASTGLPINKAFGS